MKKECTDLKLKDRWQIMGLANETPRFTAQTMSSGVLVLLILFTVFTMTGRARNSSA